MSVNDEITKKLERQAKGWIRSQITWRNIFLILSHVAAFALGSYWL